MKDPADTYTVDIFADKPSCLDAAYERQAIDDGMEDDPVFPENIAYLSNKLTKPS